MARDEKLIIRLTDDVKDEFQTIAEGMGMTMSALGSFVVGDFVRRTKDEKVMREKMMEVASDKMTAAIAEMFADPDFDRKAEQFASEFLQNAINQK